MQRDSVVKVKRDFVSFLEYNGISERYFNELIRQDPVRVSESLDEVLQLCTRETGVYNFDSIIDAALYWGATPEGHEYWSDLNFRWAEYWQTKRKNVLYF